MTPETALLLQQGKLEKTCPDCGRWEAASRYCSWCLRPSTPDEWYLNNDLIQRGARFPKVAPARVPNEYYSPSKWPEQWGECPRAPHAPAGRQQNKVTKPSLTGAAR